MAIYIDVTRLVTWEGNYTGMERFAFEVTKYLVSNASSEIRLCCFNANAGFVELEDAFSLNDDRLTSPFFGPSPALKELVKVDKKAFIYNLAQRKRLQKKQNKLSVMQATKDDVLVIYDGLWDREAYIVAVEQQTSGGVRLAHFVCDVVPLVVPQVCLDFVTAAYLNYFNRIVPHIDTLLSISNHTQKDFEQVYGTKFKPTIKKHVVRFGDSFGDKDAATKPANLNLESQHYLLAVGTVEVRKNYHLLYQAYRLALEQGIKLPKLVIVGREGWMAEATIYAIKNDPLVKDYMLFAGPVTDTELNWLYAHCLFTVFPSLYEGWGLPVAESLYYGKVCAATISSSVPEVGGDFNKYYSPYNAQACLDTIVSLLDTSTRSKLEKRIQADYVPTSWSVSGKQVTDYLS